MRTWTGHLAGIAILLLGAMNTMATEEAKYSVIERSGDFEIRDYERQIIVETIVDSSMEQAGNVAFRKLFRYISGANQSSNTIAMTAPVAQESRGEKIAMTAPVGQQKAKSGWAVSFMMPAEYTMKTLPVPTDPSLTVREIPPRRMAAVRYTGTWSQASYQSHKEKLESWIKSKGLAVTGDPVWARYNPPFTLWFMRRNEVLIPVKK